MQSFIRQKCKELLKLNVSVQDVFGYGQIKDKDVLIRQRNIAGESGREYMLAVNAPK